MDVSPFTVGQAYPHDFKGEHWPVTGLASVPWLRVNIRGERFVNETIGKDQLYSAVRLNTADSLQPQHLVYQVCDKNYAKALSEGQVKAFDQCVDYGSIKRADTLAELAEMIDVPSDAFQETVERYNAACASGVDTDYAVDSATLSLTVVREAPYYALPRKLVNTATEGGIVTNEYLQVVNENRDLIGGLWAAGTCLGGRYGYEYPWLEMAASNKMGAMSAGMNAVRSMLGTWDEAMPEIPKTAA